MDVIPYKLFLRKFGTMHRTIKSKDLFAMLSVPTRDQQDFLRFRDQVLRPLIIMSDYRLRFQLVYVGNLLDEVIINKPGQCAYLTYSRRKDLVLTEAEEKSLLKFETCYHIEEILNPDVTRRRATLNAFDRMSKKEVRLYEQAIKKREAAPERTLEIKTLVWPGLEKRDYA